MNCLNCNNYIRQTNYLTYKKFCCSKCEEEYKNKNHVHTKTLDDWVREADECGLDYGNYRALIGLGKTYEELKALK